jgi:hypothetical protein
MARGPVNRPAPRVCPARRRMSGERRDALRALALGALPLLLAWQPWAVRALPVLGLWRGPVGALWLLLALGVASSPWLARWTAGGWWPGTRVLFALTAGAYLTVGLRYAASLQASGDEPHYLLMAQSLWREGDLDLRDNLERGDYREYTPGPLVPHWGAPRPDGRPFPAHSVGLPLALAPVYALGGRRLCVVLIALAAAALALQARALAVAGTADPRAAFFAWAATAGPPLAFYSFHVYTEVPSGLALALALRLLLFERTVAGALAAALLAGVLPWLHLKMIPAAAALGVVALVELRGRARAAFVAVTGLAAAGFFIYYGAIYGRPTPLALYGGLPSGQAGSPGIAAAGLLLDRSFGLLPHAPVFLLALAGVPLLARRPRGVWPQALLAAAILAPVMAWRMWWGGQCPPARFLVPLLPLLGLAVASRLSGEALGLARWRWGLLATGLLLALFMASRPADLLLLNRGDRPTRVWSALAGDASLARYLPSVVRADAAELRVAALWLTALAFVLGLDSFARSRKDFDRCFRGLELPLLLALALGAGVDGWARPPQPAGTQAASRGGLSSPRGAGAEGAPDPLGANRSGRPRIMKPHTRSAVTQPTS